MVAVPLTAVIGCMLFMQSVVRFLQHDKWAGLCCGEPSNPLPKTAGDLLVYTVFGRGTGQVLHNKFGVRAVSPLEGYGPREWVCFERALVVRDMFTGGERTFLSQEDAQAFRARIYAQYGALQTNLSFQPPYKLLPVLKIHHLSQRVYELQPMLKFKLITGEHCAVPEAGLSATFIFCMCDKNALPGLGACEVWE